MNVQMRVHILRTFITDLLVHIHQKTKIALEIAAKIASVKGRNSQFVVAIDGCISSQQSRVEINLCFYYIKAFLYTNQ